MENKQINAIIFGATGMVGEGVLHESLKHQSVKSVLVINRKPCGVENSKLKELMVPDFTNLSDIENQLSNYNACFFCMGISSVGKKENEYASITYDLTMYIARILKKLNPEMTFCYVSGAGTDSSEKGRIMWARVKGKTENDLMKMQFKNAYMFRPGYIQPIKGMKNTYRIYKVLSPIYPILKTLFPKYVCTLENLGLSMINSVLYGYEKKVLENKDIALRSKK